MTQLSLLATIGRSERGRMMTYREIGERMGITETHAKWIAAVALSKLHHACERIGITVEDVIGGMGG